MCCWGNILWVLLRQFACCVQWVLGGVFVGFWGLGGCVVVVLVLVRLWRGFVIVGLVVFVWLLYVGYCSWFLLVVQVFVY